MLIRSRGDRWTSMTPCSKRFVETINGREYRIEVLPITASRWRAQVLTAYGGPSALMPFYGSTPESAAGQLSAWLTRAIRGTSPQPERTDQV
jgi:hypothetical protein